MSIKNVNCVKDLLSVRYPEIRFSVTSKGACIVIGITASPYVWDSMYDVLDKEASSSGRSYKSAKKEMLKYWDKNRVSVVSVTCLLYTSPRPRDGLLSRMPSSA